MASSVLVVEDDEVQQLVLKAALEQAGHAVDVAADGLSAVRMLRTGKYDLALIDYRIPEVDGLASAKLLHELMDRGVRPKLVAITASSTELETRQGEDGVFDAIIPKPLDLEAIVRLVDKELERAPAALRTAAADGVWREHGLAGAPAALIVPEPTPPQMQLLQSLFDLTDTREPDVVALVNSDCWADAVNLRENTDFFGTPFIDLTDHFDGIADGGLTGFDPKKLAAIANTILKFRERRRKLSPGFLHANDTQSRLLSYLFLSGRTLHPVRFAESKDCVRYCGFFSAAQATRIAERLERRGLLEKAFIDRIHVCSHCDSARLNAREECPGCRSSHLREEAVIHHFRCAYQGPEGSFAAGRDLVCPKCRQHLRHYGSDYDKPGTVFVCAECEHICTDVAVGFVCFDCGTHMDGDAVARRDIHSFRLTDTAIRLLTTQRPSNALPVLEDQSVLPAQLCDELARIASSGGQTEKPVEVAEISYGAEDSIVASLGRSGFERLRGIFLQNLTAALSGTAELYSAEDRDFLLSRSGLADVGEDLLKYCQTSFAEPLHPTLRPFDPFDRRSA